MTSLQKVHALLQLYSLQDAGTHFSRKTGQIAHLLCQIIWLTLDDELAVEEKDKKLGPATAQSEDYLARNKEK